MMEQSFSIQFYSEIGGIHIVIRKILCLHRGIVNKMDEVQDVQDIMQPDSISKRLLFVAL